MYTQGFGISNVCKLKTQDKSIRCRSLLEGYLLEQLDNDPEVMSIDYEAVAIPYHYDRDSTYIPDFLVKYKSGETKLIEVKPIGLIDDPVNLAKFAAAREYCKNKGWSFEVWTEEDRLA
jgi:hypothetical protein